MKRIIIILLLLGLVSFLQFCRCDSEKYFRITKIRAYISNNDYYDTIPVIPLDKFAIWIQYYPQFYSNNHFDNFNLINSAYATSPCPSDGFEGCNELVEKINVYCSADFDSTHLSNDTINSLVWIIGIGLLGDYDTIQVKLTKFKDYRIQSTHDDLTLILDKKPEIDSIQEYTVEFIMSNNEVFTSKTKKVIVE